MLQKIPTNLKILIMGLLGYLFMSLYYEQHLAPVIFGLLVAAVYFTAIKLRSMNEEYAARVKNGIKWMKISILLGILPYVIYLFLYLITYINIFRSEFFGDLIFNVWSFMDNYPYILGPLFGVLYAVDDLFPGNKSTAFIVVSLWLFVPLIIGYFIYKTRRNSSETANVSADG